MRAITTNFAANALEKGPWLSTKHRSMKFLEPDTQKVRQQSAARVTTEGGTQGLFTTICPAWHTLDASIA